MKKYIFTLSVLIIGLNAGESVNSIDTKAGVKPNYQRTLLTHLKS